MTINPTRSLEGSEGTVGAEMKALVREVVGHAVSRSIAELGIIATWKGVRQFPDFETAREELHRRIAQLEAPVYADIRAERIRQDAQWGGPEHDDIHDHYDWRLYRNGFEERVTATAPRLADPTVVRDSLVKIAALAVAQIESLDRKHPPSQRQGEPNE